MPEEFKNFFRHGGKWEKEASMLLPLKVLSEFSVWLTVEQLQIKLAQKVSKMSRKELREEIKLWDEIIQTAKDSKQ